MIQMESSLFKYIYYVVLVDVSQHNFAITVADDHDVWIKRMAIHSSYGR